MVVACTVSVPEEAQVQTDTETVSLQPVSTQVLVRLAEDVSIGDIDFSFLGTYTVTRTFPPAGRFEARHRAAGLHRWYTLTYTEGTPLTKAVVDVQKLPGIEIVESVPEVKATAEYPFNDPKFASLWGLYNPGGKTQWTEGCDVNALNAWTIETGRPEVIVAILDTGVDINHEDLKDHIWVNEAELYGIPGEDDDNNGYIDDINGFNFVTYDGTMPVGKLDANTHGTHVAGTIGAVNNNGIGVASVAGGNGLPNSGVRIMPVQMMNEQKSGSFTARAFVYAADNGAVLANCSWGNVDNEKPTSAALSQAIDYFNEYAGMDPETGEQVGPMAGGLAIFAAGNDGREVEHPAMDDNVFAVAALGANYVRSYFTSYGDWVDICAPGGDANKGVYILSTTPDNTYSNLQGSSMAAPHATGVAALGVSYYGVGKKGFTREKLINLLTSTANKHALEENGSYATKLGAGLADAYALLTAGGDDIKPLPVTQLSATSLSNSITLTWTVPGSEEVKHPYCFNVFYSTASLANLDPAKPGEDVEVVRVLSYGKSVGEIMEETFLDLAFDTKFYFRIQSEGITGLTSDLSKEVAQTTGHNTAPVITPLDGTSITLKATETGVMRFRASDEDGHTLSFSCQSDFPGLKAEFQDNLVTLTINALKAYPGTYAGVFEISDGYLATSQSFQYTVKANAKPEIKAAIEDQVFNSTSESHQLELSRYFADADDEPLFYTVSSSSTSIIVQTSVENGILNVKAHSLGTTVITITAADASGASCEQSFRVLVRNGNEKLEVYPNPVKDNMYIRTGESGNASVKMVSSLGNVVYEGNLSCSPFDPAVVNCSGFSAGVYTLMVEIGGEKFKKTVVKQ